MNSLESFSVNSFNPNVMSEPCLALDSITDSVPVPGDADRAPVPGDTTPRRRPRINDALRAMRPGQSTLVLKQDNRGLYARAACLGIKILVRREGRDHYRVWKLTG